MASWWPSRARRHVKPGWLRGSSKSGRRRLGMPAFYLGEATMASPAGLGAATTAAAASASSTAATVGRASLPRRAAAKTRRAGGVPRSVTDRDAVGDVPLGEARDERDPQARGDEGHQGREVVRAMHETRREARGGAARERDLQARRPRAGADPRVVGERLERHRGAAGQRVAGGQRGVEGILEQRPAGEARVAGRRRARGLHRDGDVDGLLAQGGEAVRALDVEQLEAQARVGRGERLGGRRGDPGQRRGEGSDDDGAELAAGVGGDVGLGALELGEERVRVLEQHVGGPGQHQPAAPALGDRLADLALERGELLRDGRGRQVQRVRPPPRPCRGRRARAGCAGGGRRSCRRSYESCQESCAGLNDLATRTLALDARAPQRPRRPHRRRVGRELRRHPRRPAALPAAAVLGAALHLRRSARRLLRRAPACALVLGGRRSAARWACSASGCCSWASTRGCRPACHRSCCRPR